MSSKRSPAAKVLDFFTTAPVGEAALVLGLVKEVVKKRTATEGVNVVGPAAPTKRRARRKVNAKAIDAVSGTTTIVQPVV